MEIYVVVSDDIIHGAFRIEESAKEAAEILGGEVIVTSLDIDIIEESQPD